MLTRLVVILGVVFIGGCSSVEMVNTNNEDPAFQNVNRAVRGQIVQMELHNGKTMNVTSVHVDADSVTWIDRRSNSLKAEPTSNVRELSVRKAGRGAITGLVVGAVVGAAAGGVRAAVEGDDPTSDPLAITKGEKFRIFPPAHALYASLFSTPIGAILGSRKRFRFEEEPALPPTVTQR